MPEKASNFYSIGKPLRVSAIKTFTKEEIITQNDCPTDDMKAVQTGDRKIHGIIGVPLRGEHGLKGDFLMRYFQLGKGVQLMNFLILVIWQLILTKKQLILR